MSDQNNEAWRQQDWDAYEEDETKIATVPLEEWVYGHDAEAHARSEFSGLAEEIRKVPMHIAHAPVAEFAAAAS
ncbi:FAD/NAD(P)-binding domain-containing protein [Penicillium bovifimosum]|uniref:FAD/NAD(P)-binding domain-containing protein n=1 Tax=Penicillium bovifimosum TaxID=126998 RepID=A0A9W9GW77_9EURO|nr:FAD/NAD(P)-binding domain-containing protein [Penicillium bovifimosum]KAJ5131071.1 FAD/NAD(P)-binding domain-containing protein [Penicillium bovifimosum]